jgi:toxin-antitoxin system PIN domain toxin
MFVVDTNILVYAANADSPFHEPSRRRLEEWRRSTAAWYLTWGICYEFLRVVTHRRVLRSPWTGAAAWRFLEAVLASPGLGLLVPTERHAAVAAGIIEESSPVAGNLWHDAMTAILMREHGISTIYTRDADFRRFPFLQVVDPVRE